MSVGHLPPEINAEPNTLTRLLNASIGELEREYGVRYRSGSEWRSITYRHYSTLTL